MIERARRYAVTIGLLAAVAFLTLVGLTYTNTDLFKSALASTALLGAVVVFVLGYALLWMKKFGWAFAMSGLAIVFTTVAFFSGLFPRIMISSLNPMWNLTIYNAASSAYTLKIMSFAALALVPIVLAYQGWTYWVFRKRVTAKELEY